MALQMPGRGGARKRAAQASPIVYRWDLDKTYLRTDFDSVRQLLRVPFERAEDKTVVPGVIELIRALKPCAERAGRTAQIFFLSASPPQIGKAIRGKLAIDAVPYDGIVFKNQLQHVLRGKFHNLREQIGFKLAELLRSRHALPAATVEILFGDDWESDAIAYSLYADTVARRLTVEELSRLLASVRVDPKIAEEVLTLAAMVTPAQAVRKIFVNLERRTPPVSFRRLGPRVVPTFNYLQTAAILQADGYLDSSAVSDVARSLVERASYTPSRLANSLADLCRRGHLAAADELAIRDRLARDGLLPAAARIRPTQRWRMRAGAGLRGLGRRWRNAMPADSDRANAGPVDYHVVLGEWAGGRLRRRAE
jgi:hypothetical protein